MMMAHTYRSMEQYRNQTPAVSNTKQNHCDPRKRYGRSIFVMSTEWNNLITLSP